jgi:hypothetical protein
VLMLAAAPRRGGCTVVDNGLNVPSSEQ